MAQLQDFIHSSSCTLVVPGVLLVAAAILCVYRQMTEDPTDLPLTGFLATILLSMLPLMALKAKIWSCADRVSLVPMVLVKTLLMHAALEVLRITSQMLEGWSYIVRNKMNFAFDTVMFVSAFLALRMVFEIPMTPSYVFEHRDVRNLVGMAIAVAFLSEAFYSLFAPSDSMKGGISVANVLFAAANYVDVVGFMPVVWRLYQAENALDDFAVGTMVSLEAKQQVRVFFGFVCTFYLWDDVLEPIASMAEEPIGMMAHAAHFIMLVDFAGFFLFQVNNPTTTKEKSEQLQGLLDEDAQDEP
ncbi:unnamed protein product [Effrenium voratum]|nr:unnamed protein product [Effrenium voratum]CAJ1424153.1 unnamed protein product [Effrenium voratum]